MNLPILRLPPASLQSALLDVEASAPAADDTGGAVGISGRCPSPARPLAAVLGVPSQVDVAWKTATFVPAGQIVGSTWSSTSTAAFPSPVQPTGRVGLPSAARYPRTA